ncbi:hypothetical protein [Mucilaginibacter jinjuensis]|uniref:Lipocalin-like protein n=1 Tax=Mucilaginibacter jinjuensis TaxID=1176721 RepID=A0ABY7T7Y5_9SPHI|nr:hypothetical protein [Mucilaginibacter jinjuensis]WCT12605.1 hypothetical protein PQO05_01505 [Mucilaginibacter jinjuensis]
MKPFVYLVFTLIAFAVIISCKKDSPKNNNDGLVGTWENRQIYPSATGHSQVFTFSANGTFETHATAFDAVSNQSLGYFYKSTGNYVLNGSDLSFSNIVYYGIPNNGSSAVPENQLVVGTQTYNSPYSVGFNAKRDSLSLLIHCPANANCIGLLWYKKK